MDFILFPPTAKHSTISQSDPVDPGEKNKHHTIPFQLTLWDQAHGPLFPSPVQDVYERVQASAEWRIGHKIYISNHSATKTTMKSRGNILTFTTSSNVSMFSFML